MPLPYENITVAITRAEAHALIEQLCTDDEVRAEFETNTREVLERNGISVPEEAMPESVTLPPKEDIEEFLTLLNEKLVPEQASPFGFALLILAFGAMPVQIGGRSTLDGAG
jgi:putative modified peptide